MIILDYQLSPSWSRELSQINLKNVDRGPIHYNLFPGDVHVAIGGTDFSARWGWVPVLDFAFCFHAVVQHLADQDEDTFEFTESEAEIRFQRQGDSVRVSANYATGEAHVPYEQLLQAARQFAERVLVELTAAYPALGGNPVVLSLWDEIRSSLHNGQEITQTPGS